MTWLILVASAAILVLAFLLRLRAQRRLAAQDLAGEVVYWDAGAAAEVLVSHQHGLTGKPDYIRRVAQPLARRAVHHVTTERECLVGPGDHLVDPVQQVVGGGELARPFVSGADEVAFGIGNSRRGIGPDHPYIPEAMIVEAGAEGDRLAGAHHLVPLIEGVGEDRRIATPARPSRGSILSRRISGCPTTGTRRRLCGRAGGGLIGFRLIGVFQLDRGALRTGVNAAFRKAKPGDAIQLYATGLASTPAGVLPSLQQLTGVTVTIGTTTVPASLAGLVAVGEFQINFTVPQISDGVYPISITVNGVASPANTNTNPPAPLVIPIQH